MAKLSLSQAWDETKRVLARDGRLFLAVGLALFVLPGLILDVSLPGTKWDELAATGAWIAVGLIAFLVSLVGQLAVIRLAIGPHVSVGEAIGHGARRLPAYLAAVLVWIVPLLLVGAALYTFLGSAVDPSGTRDLAAADAGGVIGASLALILLAALGAFLGVRFMLSSAVASAENVGPFAILRRSWQLSQGNWWRLFIFLMLFAIGAMCLIFAVDSVAGLLVRAFVEDAGPRSLGGLLVSIVSQLMSAALSVALFVMLARIYVQRTGTDGAQASVPNSGI